MPTVRRSTHLQLELQVGKLLDQEQIVMNIQANTRFKITRWDEIPFSEVEGAGKLTKASITKAFEGDVSGESTLEYLMSYNRDGSASFVGYERIKGRVGERSGSFVLKHEGTYDGSEARSTYTVVANSGTGELSGIQGGGHSRVGHAEEHSMTFEFDLP